MKYIFVDSKKDMDYIGVVEDERLVELYVEKNENRFSIGNIYRGRVDNIVKGIDSAFVDIGHYKNGYLYVKDAIPLERLYGTEELKIGDVLKNGEDIIVQIDKEGKGEKGPRLTSHITIPGTYIVLTPFSNRINVSRKIEKRRAEKLRSFGQGIQLEDIGFVIRTNAQDVDETYIEREYELLVSLYKKILREKHFLPCPKLIYKDMDFLYKLVNNGFYRDHKVLVNDRELYGSLLDLDSTVVFGIKDRLVFDKGFSLDTRSSLFEDLRRGLGRKVDLEGGGSIVIDKTEAMTVIDVNSGSYTGGSGMEGTSWDINMRAGREIAHQIRLRNITGIIIIDFIDFRDKSREDEFLYQFNKELLQDVNKANIIGMTKLGLVELTRRKTRLSDIDYFRERCSQCNSILN